MKIIFCNKRAKIIYELYIYQILGGEENPAFEDSSDKTSENLSS